MALEFLSKLIHLGQRRSHCRIRQRHILLQDLLSNTLFQLFFISSDLNRVKTCWWWWSLCHSPPQVEPLKGRVQGPRHRSRPIRSGRHLESGFGFIFDFQIF